MDKKQYKLVIIIILLVIQFFLNVSNISTFQLMISLSIMAIISYLLISEFQDNSTANTDIDDENTFNFDKADALDKNITHNLETIDKLSNSLFKIFEVGSFIYLAQEDNSWKILKSSSKTAVFKNSIDDYLNSAAIQKLLSDKKTTIVNYNDDENAFSFYEQIMKKREELYCFPIFASDNIEAIVIIDTLENDSYDDGALSAIKNLLSIYSKTINNRESSNSLDHVYKEFFRLSNTVNQKSHFFELIKIITPKLFEASNFYVTELINNDRYKIVTNLGYIENINVKDEFKLNEGIIGWSIKNSKTVLIDQLIKNNQFTVRFNQSESKPLTTKSVLFHPANKIGVGLESTIANAFSDIDRNNLITFVEECESIYKEIIKRESFQQNSIKVANLNVFSIASFKVIYNLLRSLNVPLSLIAFEIKTNKLSEAVHKEIIQKYAINHLEKDKNNSLLFLYNQEIILQLFIDEQNDINSINSNELTVLNSNKVLIENKFFTMDITSTMLLDIQKLDYDKLLWEIHNGINKIN